MFFVWLCLYTFTSHSNLSPTNMNNILNNLRHKLTNRTAQLFLFSTVLFLTLCSCSKDEGAAVYQNRLLTKLVDVAADGSVASTIFTYDANKIVSIDGAGKHSIFTYSNDLITKIVTVNNVNQTQNILDYYYTNGQLVKIISSDNYVMNFTHNDDGTVLYERLTIDANHNLITVYNGKMFFQNGNLVRDERTKGGTASTIVSKEIVSYQYDSKNNPLGNIVGYSKLLDNFKFVSVNTITRTQEEGRVEHLDSDQIESSVVLYVSANQYDDAGYPTVITSEKSFFEEQANHVKSQLSYN